MEPAHGLDVRKIVTGSGRGGPASPIGRAPPGTPGAALLIARRPSSPTPPDSARGTIPSPGEGERTRGDEKRGTMLTLIENAGPCTPEPQGVGEVPLAEGEG